MTNPKVLRGHDIVCFSSIDWDFIWQGHQEIMSTLAAQGIACCSSRTPACGRRRFATCRACGSGFATGGAARRDSAKSGRTCSSTRRCCCRCRTSRIVAAGSTASLLMRALRRWMRATGFGRPIVWTFLPTPLARDLIAELDPQLTIYYCIDDFASSSPAARRIAERAAAVPRGRSGVRHLGEAARAGGAVQRARASVSVRRELRAVRASARSGADPTAGRSRGAAASGRRLRRRPAPVGRSASCSRRSRAACRT